MASETSMPLSPPKRPMLQEESAFRNDGLTEEEPTPTYFEETLPCKT